MEAILKQIKENISGIWENQRYELILGMRPDYSFSFIDKTKDPETGISGKYFIVLHNEYYHPVLRLTWEAKPTGLTQDYTINELSAFGNLTITHDGVELQLTNRLPE
jgi:hypothetical protein